MALPRAFRMDPAGISEHSDDPFPGASFFFFLHDPNEMYREWFLGQSKQSWFQGYLRVRKQDVELPHPTPFHQGHRKQGS